MSSKESPHVTRPRLQLSATQLVASVLAAVTATIAGSYLGVNGTVIGAGIASLLTVVGNAVYGHYIHRTREHVRTVATVGPAGRRLNAPLAAAHQATAHQATGASVAGAPTRMLPRVGYFPPAQAAQAAQAAQPRQRHRVITLGRRAGVTAVAVFVVLLTLLTSVELATGRPISDLLRGTAGSGTTVFGSSQGSAAVRSPAPALTVTQTVVPEVVTQTPTVTETAPAVTVTPSPSPTGSGSPSTSAPSSPAPTTP